MTSLFVAISTVNDGSMYNRNDRWDQTVFENRMKFLEENGILATQTTLVLPDLQRDDHCRYAVIAESDKGRGIQDDDINDADAIVTTAKNHALFLPVADCIGTVFYDPIREVLMLSHLGRHSVVENGAQKSVEYLVEHFHSDPATIQVWTTPAAGKDEYPVHVLDGKGLKEIFFEQLEAAGIQPENITDHPASTTSDPHYFSWSEFRKGNRQFDGDHAIVAMMRA